MGAVGAVGAVEADGERDCSILWGYSPHWSRSKHAKTLARNGKRGSEARRPAAHHVSSGPMIGRAAAGRRVHWTSPLPQSQMPSLLIPS